MSDKMNDTATEVTPGSSTGDEPSHSSPSSTVAAPTPSTTPTSDRLALNTDASAREDSPEVRAEEAPTTHPAAAPTAAASDADGAAVAAAAAAAAHAHSPLGAGAVAGSLPAGAAAKTPEPSNAAPAVMAEAPLTMGSNKAGLLYRLTKGHPTNYDMLLFRTLNRDLGQPNHNVDGLATLLRDELLPVRSWMLKHLPGAKQQFRRSLENSLWGVPGCINFIDARTQWFDGAVTQALDAGIKQVVQVAAGFDTRAYRLSRPGVTFYEVDLPAASTRKQQLVQKLGFVKEGMPPPVYVAADLSRVDLATALAGCSFDPSQPALFTVEGLIYYLPQAAVEGLLASISRLSAPSSRLYFDFMHAAALQGRAFYPGFRVTARSVANKGEPFMSGIENSREAVTAVVEPHGFKLLLFKTPKDMVGEVLPHCKWNDRKPPIASFYSYAAVVKGQ